MNLITRPGYALIALAALAASALLVASCSDKPLSVDPSFDTPEGSSSGAARLVVWPPQPNVAALFREVPPVGLGEEDEFLGYEEVSRYPEGSLPGMVFDGTAASAFQVLRRESNGGLRQLTDYAIHSTRRWLDGKWEVYEFYDPLPTTSPAYIGRGLIAGGVTENSPLSNEARLTAGEIPNIPFVFPTDTTVTWEPVPNAAYYIGHIYSLREAPPVEGFLSGALAPIYRGYSRDFFLGLTTTPQELGRNLPFTGAVLTRRDLPPSGTTYLVRVSAINDQGQVVAYSYGGLAFFLSGSTYKVFRLGSQLLYRPRIPTTSVPGVVRGRLGRRAGTQATDIKELLRD